MGDSNVVRRMHTELCIGDCCRDLHVHEVRAGPRGCSPETGGVGAGWPRARQRWAAFPELLTRLDLTLASGPPPPDPAAACDTTGSPDPCAPRSHGTPGLSPFAIRLGEERVEAGTAGGPGEPARSCAKNAHVRSCRAEIGHRLTAALDRGCAQRQRLRLEAFRLCKP